MEWLLLVDLIVLMVGLAVFMHSFFVQVFAKPLIENFKEAGGLE